MKKHFTALLTAVLILGSFSPTVLAASENNRNQGSQSPLTISTGTNEVQIDYRKVTLEDIIIQENKVGALEKGKTINFKIDHIDFAQEPEFEIIEGDGTIESVKVDDGILTVKVGNASKTTPTRIQISTQAELQKSLPAGFYTLYIVKGDNDLFFQDDTDLFDIDKMILNDKYIEVVSNTACTKRDFDTQVQVAIGQNEGKLYKNGNEIEMDAPAYISENHVMVPVRAITEAISDAAIVRWDEPTQTISITFASRVVNMTIGEKSANINGVNIELEKACEITDGRAFIPLRDLGYILGLNDSLIHWDSETQTATLN